MYNYIPFTIKEDERNLEAEDLKKHHSFIYKIELSDGRFYIGRKRLSGSLNSINKYNSSNVFIKEHPELIVKKTILEFTDDKINTTYREIYHMIQNDKWLSVKCLNQNLLGKFYKNKIVIR